MLDVTSAVVCQLVGVDPVTANHQCYGSTDSSQTPRIGGLVGLSTSYVSALYMQPATTGQYIHYLAENFGFAGHAYAAVAAINDTTGFAALTPVIAIWNFTKNLAYLMLTLVFLLIGLGIMLRVKLDPRTVISLQNQLPKVVIGILLITFSYAIAGVLIDCMWAATYFGINLIASQSSDPLTIQRATEGVYNNPLTFVSSIFVNPQNRLQQLYESIISEGTILAQEAKTLPTSTQTKLQPIATAAQKLENDAMNNANDATIQTDISNIQSGIAQAKNNLGNNVNPETQATLSQLESEVAQFSALVATNVKNGGGSIVSWIQSTATGATTVPTNISSNGIVSLTLNASQYLGDVATDAINGMLPASGKDCVDMGLPPSVSLPDCVHQAVNFFTQIIAVLIVGVALFVVLIRIWFMLIKAYAIIIIDVIVAPLWILVGFIPGSSFGFGTWIRHIIAYMAVFPASLAMILLARVLLEMGTIAQPGSESFLPPLVGNLSLSTDIHTTATFGSLLAIGLLFMIPELTMMMKDALKVKSKPYLGNAVKTGFSGGMPGLAPVKYMGSSLFGRGDPTRGIPTGGVINALTSEYRGRLPVIGGVKSILRAAIRPRN